jgi:hypothetical protein
MSPLVGLPNDHNDVAGGYFLVGKNPNQTLSLLQGKPPAMTRLAAASEHKASLKAPQPVAPAVQSIS